MLRLEHKLAEMHATPAAAYKRAYKSLAQHVEALNLEAEVQICCICTSSELPVTAAAGGAPLPTGINMGL